MLSVLTEAVKDQNCGRCVRASRHLGFDYYSVLSLFIFDQICTCMFCSTSLPYPALPYPIISCPILSCPALLYPTLHHTSQYSYTAALLNSPHDKPYGPLPQPDLSSEQRPVCLCAVCSRQEILSSKRTAAGSMRDTRERYIIEQRSSTHQITAYHSTVQRRTALQSIT